jgi:hypothetical protein
MPRLHPRSSLSGLTRQSIDLRKKMDLRVKPGGDAEYQAPFG